MTFGVGTPTEALAARMARWPRAASLMDRHSLSSQNTVARQSERLRLLFGARAAAARRYWYNPVVGPPQHEEWFT